MSGQWALLLAAIFGAGNIAAIAGYVKDRRKANAEGRVAEATVELRVDADRLDNLEQRLDFTVKAFDLERASYENQIRVLSRDLEQARADITHRDEKIRELEARLARVQDEIQALSGELAKLRGPVDET